MRTNVKNYTDEQLLDRVKKLPSFKKFPSDYWFLFVRSSEDQSNVFDDKCYVFYGKKFVSVHPCTTNSGKYGLLNFYKWNRRGTFIIKSDQWYYDTWKRGKHKSRMEAWVQNKPVLGYRDNDKDLKHEERGMLYKGFFGINIHTVTYEKRNIIKNYINGWSVGCLVLNDTREYFKLWKKTRNTNPITACVIKEF